MLSPPIRIQLKLNLSLQPNQHTKLRRSKEVVPVGALWTFCLILEFELNVFSQLPFLLKFLLRICCATFKPNFVFYADVVEPHFTEIAKNHFFT